MNDRFLFGVMLRYNIMCLILD